MLFDIGVLTSRFAEGVVEQNLALGGRLLDGSRLVVRYEFVVDKLKNTNLANLAVDSLAVWTGLCLATLVVDLFANLGSAKVIYVWSSQFVEKLSSIRFFE